MIREHQKIPGHYYLREMISIFTSKHKEQTFFFLNLVKENAATIFSFSLCSSNSLFIERNSISSPRFNLTSFSLAAVLNLGWA